MRAGTFSMGNHTQEALVWDQLFGTYWDRHKVAKKDRRLEGRALQMSRKLSAEEKPEKLGMAYDQRCDIRFARPSGCWKVRVGHKPQLSGRSQVDPQTDNATPVPRIHGSVCVSHPRECGQLRSAYCHKGSTQAHRRRTRTPRHAHHRMLPSSQPDTPSKNMHPNVAGPSPESGSFVRHRQSRRVPRQNPA